MAVGLPLKTTYADGDVYSASDVNDTNGTINANASPYAAGKNKIINGDFNINQRNFSSTTTNGTMMFDRYLAVRDGNGTSTFSSQTFTLGAAPVAGYEGRNFLQIAIAGESSTTGYTLFQQKIESVRTLAGQTATISFWAKANSGTPKILTYVQQQFGTGGSPSAVVTTAGTLTTITTSWVRYSFPITIPSISGKTIGTNNDDFLNLTILVSAGSGTGSPFDTVGVQNNTFQFWGIQLENGLTATAFQTATGTIQGELAACQRYYWRSAANTIYQSYGIGAAYSTTAAQCHLQNPVFMRTTPTAIEYSNVGLTTAAGALNSATFTLSNAGQFANMIVGTSTGLVAGNSTNILALGTTSSYVGISAEL
jgi:hypothetical protein